ncbi:hypothetical protein CDD83_9381 [Cordyceps sp. RAO-2017]|nr:hypothetical protein CDD83_9381 [Cordyceps sp. RAO-2017]
MGNAINVFAVDPAADGLALRHQQTVSSFGPGMAHGPEAAAGELVLGPDGHDVYVSNRLTGDAVDHVARFRVAPACDGKALRLDFVNQEPCGGVSPRMMSVTPDGARLLIANVKGPVGLWVLNRDPANGNMWAAPDWNMTMDAFGGEDAAPQFVQQVR